MQVIQFQTTTTTKKSGTFRRVSACSAQRLLQSTNVIFTSVGFSNDFSRSKPRGSVLLDFFGLNALYVYLRSNELGF